MALRNLALPSLAGAPWLVSEPVRRVMALLEDAGQPARVVGGSVRNALIGVPVVDVDIATTAVPERVIDLAAGVGLRTVPTGIDHGTVTVIIDGQPVEVTTLRRDVETDGRRAVVVFTRDFREDAMRRDFTMNALYCAADGTLCDPLGGWADLVRRKVRFIGDAGERIREDFLRILRFFRFNAEIGRGPLDSDGLVACVAHKHGLAGLSVERVSTELIRMLGGRNAVSVVRIMAARGILSSLGLTHIDVDRFAHLADIEEHRGNGADPLLRLAALSLALEGEPGLDAAALSSRLRLSNAQMSRLSSIAVAPLPSPTHNEKRRLECLYRWDTGGLRDRTLIAWAISGAAADNPAWTSLLEWIGTAGRPVFPLRGRDLGAIGVANGPGMGALLTRLETHWIDGGFTAGRDDLLALAERWRTAG